MQEDLDKKPEDVVTNFENEQEEKAIISYQELLDSIKEKSPKVEVVDDELEYRQEKEMSKKLNETIQAIENNETNEIEEGNNGIKIANDVISVIAGVAVSEVQGVASMAGGFAGGISQVFSGKKNLSRGIKVEADEKEVKIDVNIIVEYGTRIPDVAYEIQNRVKKSVENMTGLKVAEVNVHVQGVKTEKDVEDKDEEKDEEKTVEE